MLLKIKSVDMDGYCGREYHPAKSDEGLVVLVVGCEVWGYDAEGESFPLLDGGPHGWVHMSDGVQQAAAAQIDDADAGVVTTIWTCVTRDDRRLELIDHEVELFRS